MVNRSLPACSTAPMATPLPTYYTGSQVLEVKAFVKGNIYYNLMNECYTVGGMNRSAVCVTWQTVTVCLGVVAFLTSTRREEPGTRIAGQIHSCAHLNQQCLTSSRVGER